jgi:hypothetical protein
MDLINRCVVVVKVKQPFSTWANGLPDAGSKTTLDRINSDSHVYLFPEYAMGDEQETDARRVSSSARLREPSAVDLRASRVGAAVPCYAELSASRSPRSLTHLPPLRGRNCERRRARFWS